MINLFQFAPNDQSLVYLSQVFGNVGSVLPIQPNAPVLLPAMFRTFNSIILAVAVLVIVYVTVVGVMKTAGEGEFLGKGWNSLWVPIRLVLGVAALVPAPSGYSGIQIVMMWVIVQGIGAADTIWNTALTAIKVTGSPYASVQIPYAGVSNTMGKVFQGLVCSATAHRKDLTPGTTQASNDAQREAQKSGGYYCYFNGNEDFCQQGVGGLSGANCSDPNQCVLQLGPHLPGLAGACGTVTYCNQTGTACSDPNSVACSACKAQASSLGNILTSLGSIADKFAQADFDFRTFYVGGKPPDWVQSYCAQYADINACKDKLNQGDNNNLNTNVATGLIWPSVLAKSAVVNGANFLDVSISDYTAGIVNSVTQVISQQVAQGNTELPPQLQEAKTTGWIFAGAYYYYIAQMNNNNLKDANPTFGYVGTDPKSDSNNLLNNNGNNYRNNYSVAGDLITFLNTNASSTNQGFSSSAPPQMQGLSSKVFSAESGIFQNFMNTVTGAGANGQTQDPLAKVQSLGESILLTIEILFGVLVILVFALALAGNIDIFALGTGAIDPLGPSLATILLFLVPVILGFMGTFMGIGATLAVYVPLIPYMIFTFGVIGWFIATIEAMIAGPIVALGIMTPGGQHDVLGRAEPALMMIFGIFLRPALMIFGMMAAMLLSAAIVTMVNASFETVMLQITAYQLVGNQYSLPGQTQGSGGGGVDLLELIFFMAAYVMLIVSVLNKCFSLIHVVPDRLLRWIGHHGAEEGAPHLEEVKGAVGAAAGRAAGAATKAPKLAAKAGAAERKQAEARAKGGAGEDKQDTELPK